MWIALEVFGLTVFAAAQIDGLFWNLDALFRREDADDARIGPDRVVKFHGVLPSVFQRQDALNRPKVACQTRGNRVRIMR
jgi:hypothetical protein